MRSAIMKLGIERGGLGDRRRIDIAKVTTCEVDSIVKMMRMQFAILGRNVCHGRHVELKANTTNKGREERCRDLDSSRTRQEPRSGCRPREIVRSPRASLHVDAALRAQEPDGDHGSPGEAGGRTVDRRQLPGQTEGIRG